MRGRSVRENLVTVLVQRDVVYTVCVTVGIALIVGSVTQLGH